MKRFPILIVILGLCYGCQEAAGPEPLLVAAFVLALPEDMSATLETGQTIDLHRLVTAARSPDGVELAPAQLRAIPAAQVGWAWQSRRSDADMVDPEEPHARGWVLEVPDFGALGFAPNGWGAYPVWLHVWITRTGPQPLDAWGASQRPDDTLPPP